MSPVHHFVQGGDEISRAQPRHPVPFALKVFITHDSSIVCTDFAKHPEHGRAAQPSVYDHVAILRPVRGGTSMAQINYRVPPPGPAGVPPL